MGRSLGASSPAQGAPTPAHERARALVDEYLDFVWRSLRRLGVPEADCDDGCQRVWIVVVRKLHEIEPGKERSYVFSVAVRVASEMRRSNARRPVASGHREELPSGEVLVGSTSGLYAVPRDNPEQALERRQAQELLQRILDDMPWDLRTVFVLFELDGLGSHEIAQALELPRGTVASRLRRAREHFSAAVERAQARQERYVPAALPPHFVAKGALG